MVAGMSIDDLKKRFINACRNGLELLLRTIPREASIKYYRAGLILFTASWVASAALMASSGYEVYQTWFGPQRLPSVQGQLVEPEASGAFKTAVYSGLYAANWVFPSYAGLFGLVGQRRASRRRRKQKGVDAAGRIPAPDMA